MADDPVGTRNPTLMRVLRSAARLQELVPDAVLVGGTAADQRVAGDGVASQLVRQLAEPAPKDRSTTRNLRQYKNLAPRWQEWHEVVSVCRSLATAMVGGLR